MALPIYEICNINLYCCETLKSIMKKYFYMNFRGGKMELFTKKRKLNVNAFDMTDYLELNYEQLLSVNGGCGSGYSRTGISGSCGGGYGTGTGCFSTRSSSGSCGSGSVSSISTSSNGSCGGSSDNGACAFAYVRNIDLRKYLLGSNKTLYDIGLSIYENFDKKYNNEGDQYRCDNWVEEVLNDAGYDSTKFLSAGNSYCYTVKQHIDALTSGDSSYTTTTPTKDGVYVVFMGDGTFKNGTPAAEHCTLYVVNNGVGKVWDNSSGNSKNYLGRNIGESNLWEYSPYKTFYFQEVKK